MENGCSVVVWVRLGFGISEFVDYLLFGICLLEFSSRGANYLTTD